MIRSRNRHRFNLFSLKQLTVIFKDLRLAPKIRPSAFRMLQLNITDRHNVPVSLRTMANMQPLPPHANTTYQRSIVLRFFTASGREQSLRMQ